MYNSYLSNYNNYVLKANNHNNNKKNVGTKFKIQTSSFPVIKMFIPIH